MKTELLAWLINATVATSLATLAVLLLRKPLQRWLGAQIAYRLWVAVPLAAIAASFPLPHPAPVATAAAPASVVAPPAVVVNVTSRLASLDADRWLLAVWILGALALFVLLAVQQRRFIARLRLRQRSDGSWRSALEDASPAVLGVLRQRLVLPERFETDYSHDEQRLVLAHERMHQQRRDPWALATCASLRTLFWFNPLVHAAATSFRRDIELACDAAVLRAHPGSLRRYADALLKTHLAGHPLPVGCLWQDTPPMKERIMLLKYALPARRARLAGAILVSLAAVGTAGIAMAGHDAAIGTASALAAASSPASNASLYQVTLAMSVNGKPVAHPSVLTRAGQTAMVKIDEDGLAWGFRFHVDTASGAHGIALTGDVFANDEQHVIGHSHHEESSGGPMVITLQEKAGGPNFRIEAQVARATSSPHAGRPAIDEAYASATPRPGERREIRIERNGTPGAPDEVDDIDFDDAMDDGTPVTTPPHGAHREIRRKIVMNDASSGTPRAMAGTPEPDDIAIETGDDALPGTQRRVERKITVTAPRAHEGSDGTSRQRRIERQVIIESDGGGSATLPPLPPTPEAVPAPTPPPTPPVPPLGLRAPKAPPVAMLAPPAPPRAATMRAPPAPPALPARMATPAPPAPVALHAPATPPALPTPMAMRAPPAPPAPMRLARVPRAPAAPPAAPPPPAPPAIEGVAPAAPTPPVPPTATNNR